MAFTPAYTITDRLLANIKRITTLVHNLNTRRFPHVVFTELEKKARAISAYASTSIEGNPLPLTEVKKLLKSAPSHVRDSEREVLNYNKALTQLDQTIQHKRPPSLQRILSIHKDVMTGLLPPFQCGVLRTDPVVVNDPKTGNVVYLPPDATDVLTLMNDLVAFAQTHKTTIDPLILAGIFHKQMVIIHPFPDGNGRTTRLATKMLLAEMGLNTFHLFSFETYYNNNVSKYFQFVGEYGNYYELIEKSIDFTPWLEYFMDGIVDELLRVEKLLPTPTNIPEYRLEKHHRTFLTWIETHGSITDREYARLTPRAKPTRTLDFHRLRALGLIERKGKGKATYYVLKGS